MSYNIDTVQYVSGKLTIEREKALDYADDHDDLPESCFLDQITRKSDEVVEIKHPRWAGSGSDERGFKAALALTKGEAELLLIFEGGDSISGLHVKDGVVTKKKVKFVLND